jgi:hypothetical protein
MITRTLSQTELETIAAAVGVTPDQVAGVVHFLRHEVLITEAVEARRLGFQVGEKVQRVSLSDSAEVGEVTEIGTGDRAGSVRVFWAKAGAYGRGARTWVRADRLTKNLRQPEARRGGALPVPAPKAQDKTKRPQPVRITATLNRPLDGLSVISLAVPGAETLWHDFRTVAEADSFLGDLQAEYPGAKVTVDRF